ncbi:hypothetical protein B0H13DRAFT_2648454 [Mycena leptocephala]|nr:hypothetical protein B0H13DRAFT_2648454 [Mycena leptocephala]
MSLSQIHSLKAPLHGIAGGMTPKAKPTPSLKEAADDGERKPRRPPNVQEEPADDGFDKPEPSRKRKRSPNAKNPIDNEVPDRSGPSRQRGRPPISKEEPADNGESEGPPPKRIKGVRPSRPSISVDAGEKSADDGTSKKRRSIRLRG